MKATKAYIASLGTTGVLLGASILMLAVVSAVVAFDRWPSGQVSTRVQTLVLSERATPIRVSPNAARGGAGSARTAAGLRGVGRAGVPPTTGVPAAGGRVASGRATGPAAPAPARPGSAVPPVPPLPIGAPINPDAGGTRNQVADQVQTGAGSAGGSVGEVSPQVGQAVTTAGQSAADALRQVPLPGPVVPAG